MGNPAHFKSEKEMQNLFRDKNKDFCSLMGLPKPEVVTLEYTIETNVKFYSGNKLLEEKKTNRRIDAIIMHETPMVSIFEFKKESKGSKKAINSFTGAFQLLHYTQLLSEKYNAKLVNFNLFFVSDYIDKDLSKICYVYKLPIRFIYMTKDGFEEYFISEGYLE